MRLDPNSPYIAIAKYTFSVVAGGALAIALVKGGYNLVRGGTHHARQAFTKNKQEAPSDDVSETPPANS